MVLGEESDTALSPDAGNPDEPDVVEITLTEGDTTTPAKVGEAEEWVVLREAAERAAVSVSTLRRWYRQGRIRAKLERGPTGDRRIVLMSEVLGNTSGNPQTQRAHSPAAAEPAGRSPEAGLQPSPADEDLLPIQRSAWEKLLQQLGNLHEAGQQLAEARERAARAEERYASAIERRKLLERRVAELTKLQESDYQVPPPVEGHEPVAAIYQPEDPSQPQAESKSRPSVGRNADQRPSHQGETTAADSPSIPDDVPDAARSNAEAEIVGQSREPWSQRRQRFLNRLEADLDKLLKNDAAKLRKQHRSVLGMRMAYFEVGRGDPIVFLHGNPTSSYLWRNVMPHLDGQGRLIAPDLIGMGDSEKLFPSGPLSYSFADHRTYLDALLQELGVTSNVTLVVHEWGAGLGFDWANRNRHAVKGIAYMEPIVGELAWNDWPHDSVNLFRAMRSEAGEEMVLTKNVLVEQVLPASIMRDLTEAEMGEYRRPFMEVGEARRPTLSWPRQVPFEGDPPDIDAIVKSYSSWLAEAEVPKLFVNADPGWILTGRQREMCRSWPNQTEVTVRGLHLIQEDSPEEIGSAIADWYTTL